MRFRLADVDVRWSGIDDTTPPGYCLADGFDKAGNRRLWLFGGAEPSDEGFRGSILLPADPAGVSVAYGPTGVYVRSSAWGHDTTAMLTWLADSKET